MTRKINDDDHDREHQSPHLNLETIIEYISSFKRS
jgi:hypothetical protein